MLTWALADDLKDKAVTANAVNPGYVLTPLTTNTKGPLKLLIALTRFAAQTPLDGADTALWAAASPDLEGVTNRFWTKRHEISCSFRDPAEIQKLRAIVEQQMADTSATRASVLNRAATSGPPTRTMQ